MIWDVKVWISIFNNGNLKKVKKLFFLDANFLFLDFRVVKKVIKVIIFNNVIIYIEKEKVFFIQSDNKFKVIIRICKKKDKKFKNYNIISKFEIIKVFGLVKRII